jgi:hypothetical protein
VIAEKIQALEAVAVEVAVNAETAVVHPMIYISDVWFWEYAEAVAQTAVAVVVLAVAAVPH